MKNAIFHWEILINISFTIGEIHFFYWKNIYLYLTKIN